MNFPIVLIHILPLKSGQPLYSGRIAWSQWSFLKRFNCNYSTRQRVQEDQSGIAILFPIIGNVFKYRLMETRSIGNCVCMSIMMVESAYM